MGAERLFWTVEIPGYRGQGMVEVFLRKTNLRRRTAACSQALPGNANLRGSRRATDTGGGFRWVARWSLERVRDEAELRNERRRRNNRGLTPGG